MDSTPQQGVNMMSIAFVNNCLQCTVEYVLFLSSNFFYIVDKNDVRILK